MLINEKLREARRRRGYTQRELGEMLCVVTSAVAHWECGRSSFNVATVQALAKALDVPVCWFFCNDVRCEVFGDGQGRAD